MADMCTYGVDRDATLIAYLYDDIDPQARARFDLHLASCAACRDELRDLRSVRGNLASWAPPQRLAVTNRQPLIDVARQDADPYDTPPAAGHLSVARPASIATLHQRPAPVDARPQSWWRGMPAWAQVAAALLFLGVAAGIANLDVRYDAAGLSVRTGWWKPAASPRTPTLGAAPDAATHAELVALEQQLRTEMHALEASAHGRATTDAQSVRVAADADMMRRTRTLVDDAEKRQQRELALRIGELLRDVNAQRQADLMRIDRSLGLVQNNLGVEVLKQRQQVNYLMRVNQRQ